MSKLSDLFTDVSDTVVLGAVALSQASTNCGAINDAIVAAGAAGKHLVFPAGDYYFQGKVAFDQAELKTWFLAGARLVPVDDESYVQITGSGQTLVGLWVEPDADTVVRSPMVEVYGASGVMLVDARIKADKLAASAAGPSAAVRVMCLTKCKFVGGSITGADQEDAVGLWLAKSYDYDKGNYPNPNPGQWNPDCPEESVGTAQATSGAYETGAIGLTIRNFGWAVRVSATVDNPTFMDCSFLDNASGALLVRDDADVTADYATAPRVVALALVGCRMVGGSPDQYVQVESGSLVHAGLIAGCTFGGSLVTVGGLDSDGLLATGAAAGGSADQPSGDSDAEVTDSVPGTTVALVGAGVDIPLPPDREPHVPDPSPAFEPGADRCIFRVEGTLDAVFVSGCASRPERRSSTWILPSSGNVNRSCDAFNHWAERTIASDVNASRLAYLRADGGAGLELAAPTLRFSTEALGFYDALATSRADPYSRGSRVSRTLSGSSTVEQVLSQLLADLSALGLVDATVAW